MRLVPHGRRLLLKRDSQGEKTTAAGLVLPSTGEKPQTATVIAVGPDVNAGVSKGDTVILGKYSGIEFEYEGETYLVVQDNELLVSVKK